MHILRIILIAAGVVVVAFGVLLTFVLMPKRRNVGDQPAFAVVVDKPLPVKRTVYVYQREDGECDFATNELTERVEEGGKNIHALIPGTVVRFEKVTLYTNSVSGFSRLWAIGRIEEDGKKGLPIAYRLGDCTSELYGDTPYPLPMAPWQDSTDRLILLDKKDKR